MVLQHVAYSLSIAIFVTAALLASGDQSYGDELSPRSVNSAQSAGCRRCCDTGDDGQCAQAYNGKRGKCAGQDRCCPFKAILNESTGNCSFNPFTPCVRDTGGSCTFFTCSSLREAAQCVGGRCLCRPGYCSVNGVCSSECNKHLETVDDNNGSMAYAAPNSTCWWSYSFLNVFGYEEYACSWPLNNYGHARCVYENDERRDGICLADNGHSLGEEACWLGTQTDGSIQKFAYKCEPDTGRAFSIVGCNRFFSCPGNSTCDSSGRCVCSPGDCSVNGNCVPIEKDWMPERVEKNRAGDSALNNPVVWVFLVIVVCCCGCLICQNETLELEAFLENDRDKKMKVTIDLDHLQVSYEGLESVGRNQTIQSICLDQNVLTINLENRNMFICDKNENEDKWPVVERMHSNYTENR